MDIVQWYYSTVKGDSHNTVAKKAGVNTSTVTRQLNAGRLEPALVVPIARAYSADVLEALMVQGLITAADCRLDRLPDVIRRLGRQEVIESLTDQEIADVVWNRLADGETHQPLTDPVGQPAAVHRLFSQGDDEQEPSESDYLKMAALDPGYPPDAEDEQ
ncbi:hypothetical protein [Actinomyces faecalis]|uniref:hypothetical protein n=1 Tax=Actinomyces faecalis TaxID=2722820 RepID=UPI001556E56E|nr:hypothetical protein [Actinomyces faecalis]